MDGIQAIALVLGLIALGLGLRYGNALRQQSLKAQKKASLLEAEIAGLQANQTALLDQAAQLQGEVNQLSGENLALQQEIERLHPLAAAKDDLAQVRTAIAQQTTALERLNQDIAQRQTTISQLEQARSSLQTQQTDLQQALHSLGEQKISLNRSLYSLQQQIEKLRTDHQTLETACLALTDRHAQLRREIDHWEQEIERLNLQTQDLQAYQELLQQENQALEAQHDSLQDRDQQLPSRANLLEQQQQLLQSRTNLLEQQEELLQTIDHLEAENAQISNQLLDTQGQLEQENQVLRRIKIVSACRHHSTGDRELFHAQIAMNFGRVREALDFAEIMFGHVLEVWESARTSADVCNFIRPDDAYRSLQSLAWFGEYYFGCGGDIGNNLYSFLRERYNLACTPESETIKNNRKLRNERCFWNGSSQRKEMLDHLKIGGGTGMNNILRIYFAINRESEKIEIGHCGKHLST